MASADATLKSIGRWAGHLSWTGAARARLVTGVGGALLLLAPFSPGVARADQAKSILVLYENNRLLPANVEADRALNDVVNSGVKAGEVNAEFLDYPRFEGEAFSRTVTTYLREKYASHPPDVIVAGGSGALDFLLRNRAQLFPGVPVVHMGVEREFVDARTLPPDVRGVPVQYDSLGTIQQALKLHPRVSHLVVVTGASDADRATEAVLRRELVPLQSKLSNIEFLSGLATRDVRTRVADLRDDAVVFTPGYFLDGAGRSFTPRQAAAEIAAAASVPAYGPYNTFIGVGVVGGRVTTFGAMGEMAGKIVNELLDGRSPTALVLPDIMPSVFTVDARQLQRWGIAERELPADTEVHFGAPTFWDEYRLPALFIIVAFLLQTALLGGLLFERRRRRRAERAVDKHRFELAHASRLAVAGELTASIAHEINQPLGAILSNVAAADLILGTREEKDGDLRQILEDIRRDDMRASEVIRRLRTLLEKHEVERTPVELNGVLADTAVVLRAEARRRRVELSVHQAPLAVTVLGDRVQMQQILVNLVLNAMDAVADRPEGHRTVVVSLMKQAAVARVEVSDSGNGISSDHLSKLFDSFFTTKRHGIGLGLSIVRTLVETHGGRVWAANGPSAGAIFSIEFPLQAGPATRKVA